MNKGFTDVLEENSRKNLSSSNKEQPKHQSQIFLGCLSYLSTVLTCIKGRKIQGKTFVAFFQQSYFYSSEYLATLMFAKFFLRSQKEFREFFFL